MLRSSQAEGTARVKEPQGDGHQRAAGQVEGSERTYRWCFGRWLQSWVKNHLEATEPRGVWAGWGRGLELSGPSGAGLGQWTRGIQRQLGYPTWGRDGRDPGSGLALRLTWILCCVWFEMLQDTQGKGWGQVAIGVWDPRGNWGPGYEVGLELALMGSGKGVGPAWAHLGRRWRGSSQEQ